MFNCKGAYGIDMKWKENKQYIWSQAKDWTFEERQNTFKEKKEQLIKQ